VRLELLLALAKAFAVILHVVETIVGHHPSPTPAAYDTPARRANSR
jgi:hypothetical protein